MSEKVEKMGGSEKRGEGLIEIIDICQHQNELCRKQIFKIFFALFHFSKLAIKHFSRISCIFVLSPLPVRLETSVENVNGANH